MIKGRAVFFLIAALVTSLAGASSAREHWNSVVASQMAQRLSVSKSPQDLLSLLHLSKKDQTLAQNYLTEHAITQMPRLNVSLQSGTRLTLKTPERETVLDFRELSEGVIFVQGQALKAGPGKTFLNHLGAIEQIFMKRKGSAIRLLLPEATADDRSNWHSTNLWLASVVATAGLLTSDHFKDLPDDELATVLSAAPQEEAASAADFAQRTGQAAFFAPTLFQCKGKNLDQVWKQAVVTQGRIKEFNPRNSFDVTVTWNPEKQRFVIHEPGGCVTEAEADGTVKGSSKTGCAKEGSNFLENAGFFYYPKLAERCCAQEGCAEKVRSAIQKLAKSLVEKQPVPPVSSAAGQK